MYRVRHGDGVMFYGACFEYLGSRNYPRRIMELMEPVPFDELYDATRGNPPHLALNLEGAAEALKSDDEWTTGAVGRHVGRDVHVRVKRRSLPLAAG